MALDAASRGLRTALVERDDFASGTSSKSSKLVHGGLRYLQQHEYRLVYENLAERQRLLENAPHLVSPLPFLIPLFGQDGVVNASVARVYRTALWLYDLTGGVRIGRRHEQVTREQALAHMPTLRADRLVAGFLYWDARTDDARLTLDRAPHRRPRPRGGGGQPHPRSPALPQGRRPGGRGPGRSRRRRSPSRSGPRWWSTPPGSGPTRSGPSTRTATPTPSGRPRASTSPCPTRPFPCDIAAVIPVREDHRSIFVVSWGDQVYLGTTDTDYDGPLDDPACTPEDVDYILGAANAVTTRPTRPVPTSPGSGPACGPLLAPGEGRHARASAPPTCPGATPCRTSAGGMVTVTGGKLTTYRKMAEDTVDAVVERHWAAGASGA